MQRFDATAGARALRIAVFNELTSRTSTLWFAQPAVRIGRSGECDLVLFNGYVSSSHAAIGMRGGRPHVMQIGTSNKLLVDSVPLQAGQMQQLVGSEVITVRPFRLTVSLVPAAECSDDVIHDPNVRRGAPPAPNISTPGPAAPAGSTLNYDDNVYTLGQRFGIVTGSTTHAQLLAQQVDGLVEILLEHAVRLDRARASFRETIKLPLPAPLGGEANTDPGVAARKLALEILASDPQALERLNVALREQRRHQVAFVDGMKASVRALLRKLSPQAIEQREAQSRALMSAKNLWRAFARIHSDLAEGGHHLFSTIFGPPFSEAYAKIADGGPQGADQAAGGPGGPGGDRGRA